MSEAEFMQAVSRLKGWAMQPLHGAIRRTELVSGFTCSVCPIAAVANEIMGTRLTLESRLAAFAIGIPEDLRIAVVNASDNNKDAPLRVALLQACHLNEETT